MGVRELTFAAEALHPPPLAPAIGGEGLQHGCRFPPWKTLP